MTVSLSRRGLFAALSRTPTAPGSEQRPVARIGEACIETKGVACRRCGEVCDVNAIAFRLIGRGRAQPLLDETLCTGCGDCVAPCPVSAIALQPRAERALARGLVELGRDA
ncbi:MAG: 4Fe-4S dicluster domain-containing protein [Methylobacteriaceae bacterium]|nr:4Fe-4S dicluster domain-containing protein [Methylobacteriaceae bacterium]